MAVALVGLLEEAVAHARDGVTITSADLDAPGPTILYVNPAFTRITGYSAAEAIGRSPRILQGPKTDRQVLKNVRQALTSGTPFFGEAINYRKDGSEFCIQWQLSPICDSFGKTTHWVAIQRDVTEQRRAEQEHHESQANWQSVVETAPDFLLILERNGTIRFINRTLPHLTQKDVVGANLFAFIEPDFHDSLQQAIKSVYQTRQHTECELLVREGQGAPAWFHARLGPLWKQHDIDGVVCIATDVTKRKETEDFAREQQAELARVLRIGTIGEMAASLAHELNQPLSIISNYAHGGVRALKKKTLSVDQQIETFEHIGDQAIAAAKVVSRWKQFTAKAKPQRSTVDLNELLLEIVEFIKPYAAKQQVTISLCLAEALPLTSADRIQIQQVVINLLHNAFEAMHDMQPALRQVVVETSVVSGQPLVSIIDHGPGMSKAETKQAFESYLTTKPEGLGMGLSISKTIIELHEGRLWAFSTSPHGMTFCFSLQALVGDQ